MYEKRLLVNELHVPARRNLPRRHVIVHGYDLWQADVIEMRPYTRFNRGYHYILTVMDVLSKHSWAVPLKAKSGNDVTNAIAKIKIETIKVVRKINRYTPNWTTEVFKIIKVQQTNPVTYLLEDFREETIAGGFYE
ncbi:PREDICTED: uncharacterized protein LOC108764477 [Trachymyrmex cornetzi]|uniref:uncharacterized protein LOC108764477 n=1 Tax=Trachymyrmex cornetzi TaxID=471704 RepID=UPI00084F27D6|nr:PREDICTED: uncharacterized protein LOC108764477 [Trachymyrmex cornetzi]